MSAGIGHNNGPSLDGGVTYRRFVWTRARAELIAHRLPIEVIRRRVRRAEELGLPYHTYASVRASTGRDVIGFLFSSNALRLVRRHDQLPQDRLIRLGAIRAADRTAVLHPGLDPSLPATAIDAQATAPAPHQSWSAMRDHMTAILRDRGLPADGVLVIGDTWAEADWAEAARTAGFLPSDRYFTL